MSFLCPLSRQVKNSIISFHISKHLVSLHPNQLCNNTVEPPSPIVKEQRVSADRVSDDPLSNSIFMVMGCTSDNSQECFFVCAWSAHTGLSYIGAPGNTVS